MKLRTLNEYLLYFKIDLEYIYTNMTCFNKTLPINFNKMKDVFMKKLDKIIEHELYYLENVKDQNKDKLRNITKNGDKKHYLCRTHNKDHVPKKKDVIPNNIDLVKIDIKKKYSENKVNEISFKEVNNSYNMNEVIQLKDKRLKRNMINKNKLKQKHKIYINGFNKTCNNKICKYKHTNEEFLIRDILYNSNSDYILTFQIMK